MQRHRLYAIAASVIAAAALTQPAIDAHGRREKKFDARLEGLNEVPAVSTKARGRFEAKLSRDGQSLRYELSFSGLTGTVLQSHIHLGRSRTNGGIMVWLCQSATNPDPTGFAPFCENQGTFTGTLTNANVIGPAGQGISAGEFEEVIAALGAGAAYANVHTTAFPGGEIRGQVRED